jgi:hypothetical protein
LGPDRYSRTCPIVPVYMEMAELKSAIYNFFFIFTHVKSLFDYTDIVIKIFKARNYYTTALMWRFVRKL